MLNLSKFFKNDIVNIDVQMIPIVLIVDDKTEEVLHILSTHSLKLNIPPLEEQMSTLPIIDKIQNIKNSNDYDSKKFKINRFRCTIFNYLDNRIAFTDNVDLSGKKLYLYYKSPTTNILPYHTETEDSDSDCALIFKGIITRLEHNEEKINILAEDQTQVSISDKNVPYNDIKKLPPNIQDNLLEEYTDDDNLTVPMTFGDVDKAPVIAYLNPDKIGELHILFDMHRTSSTYKTAKIPSLNTQPLPTDSESYFLYIKDDDDYIILDHIKQTINQQNRRFSKVILLPDSENDLISSYILPELRTDEINNTWAIRGFQQRLVKSAMSGYGKAWDIINEQVNSQFGGSYSMYANNDMTGTGIEHLNDNAGFGVNKWFRSSDPIGSYSYNITDENDLNIFTTRTGHQPTGYQPNRNDHFASPNGGARWILLRLDKGAGYNLRSIYNDGAGIGNTFIMADWVCSRNILDNEVNTTDDWNSSVQNATKTGYFVIPIANELWRPEGIDFEEDTSAPKRIQGILEGLSTDWSDSNNYHWRYLLDTLLENEGNVIDRDIGSSNNHDENRPYEDCPFFLRMGETFDGDTRYFGRPASINGNPIPLQPYQRMQGLHYGDTGELYSGGWDWEEEANEKGRKILPQTPDEHQNILIFDFYSKNMWDQPFVQSSWDTKLMLNNFGLLHSVHIPDLREEKLFASISGRRSVFYTQELYSDIFNYGIYQEDYSLQDLTLGLDGQLPRFAELRIIWENIIQNNLPHSFDSWYPETLEQDYNNYMSNYISDNSVITRSYQIFKYVVYDTIRSIQWFWKQIYWNESNTQLINNHIANNNVDYTIEEVEWWSYSWLRDSAISKILKDLQMYLYQYESGPDDLNNASDPNLVLFQDNYFAMYFPCPIFLTSVHTSSQFIAGAENDSTIKSELIQFFYQVGNLTCYFGDEIGNQSVAWNDEGPSSSGFGYGYTGDMNEYMVNGFITWLENYQVNYIEDFIINLYDNYHGLVNWDLNPNYVPTQFPHLFNFNQYINYSDYTSFITGLSDHLNEVWNSQNELVYTDGKIEKPSDIVMNILTNELKYALRYSDDITNTLDDVPPNYDKYDLPSINQSREIHTGWKMGFSINKITDGKKLIEKILQESQSYPKFSSDSKFGLINIKNSYTNDDIDFKINEKDIFRYKIEKTRLEDVKTSYKMFYKKNGNNYDAETDIINIIDLIPEYTGLDYYNLSEEDTYVEMKLNYHTDHNTVNKFINFKLLNECNVHNIINLDLPLKYIEITVGSVIYIPLINNKKTSGLDYSKVTYLNGQPIYPLWLVMESNIQTDKISLKAYQLHYLGTDSNHGFVDEDDNAEIIGNMYRHHSTYMLPNFVKLKNWNFNPLANIHNNLEIPYGDSSGDGIINVIDIIQVVNHILETDLLEGAAYERLAGIDFSTGQINTNQTIDVTTIVALVDLII